jgi:[protein-PII] uridylyltransferase
MSDYFQRTRTALRAFAQAWRGDQSHAGVERHAVVGGVTFVDAGASAAEPSSWLRVFEAAVARNAPVSEEAMGTIRQSIGSSAPDTFLRTDRDRQHFVRFLFPRPGLSARLADMEGCGLLRAMFPELAQMSHALLAIRHLEQLPGEATLSGERFGPVLQELRTPELLVLSLLFHQAGTSGEHDPDEALRVAKSAFDRLQLAAELHRTVEFLIGHQLHLSRMAFRRDAEDPETIRVFAALFPTEEHLKMLSLMTLADLGATSPETLTPWKEELLWRLYVDTYNQITLAYGDEVIDENESALAALQANRPSDITEVELATFVAGLPKRYLTLFDAESIYEHVRLSHDIRYDDVHFFLKRKADIRELTVVTLDKPFLFSNICGVLSFFGMNILRGYALTSLGGLVVDVFQFTDHEGYFQKGPTAEAEFNALLSDVVARRTDLNALLRDREPKLGPMRTPPVIYFDNEHSRQYTVLELVADDRPGLLRRISQVVSKHGLSVELVLISTEGDKAVDVFHLRKGTEKLSDSDQIALTEDLERTLEEGDGNRQDAGTL